MSDLDFIKNFSKISVSRICRENGITRTNLLVGKSTPKNERIIRNAIENEILKLYKGDRKNGVKTNPL